jgi:cbb3-type cytochrome oxidase subunit 1
VSLWYALAAGIWTIFNLPLGAVLLPYGPVNGVNSAAIHGLCMHNLVGLWITPARLATIYYFLTLSAKNMPIQGARWHPVWHGTEAMMVHGGLLIRSRLHSFITIDRRNL